MSDSQDVEVRLRGELVELQQQLERSERQTSQTLLRATRLAQVIAILGQGEEFEEMLSRAATEVANLFSADVGALLLGHRELCLEGQWGLDPEELPAAPVLVPACVMDLSATESVRCGPAVELGVPPWLASYDVRHVAWVKLIVEEEPLGVMVLARCADEPFDRSEGQELRAIGYRIALAIQNRQLQRGLRRQVAQLRRLHHLTIELAGKLDLDEVGDCIVQTIAREVPGSAVAVYVAQTPGDLELLAQAGESATRTSWLGQLPPPPGEAFLPLENASARVGAVLLSDPPSNDSEAYEVLTHLVDLAGLAIQKAILYERTREQARRDSLTGLLGHRAFHEDLEHGLREGLPGHDFSLVLVDIDDFKQINDLYGHPAGDDALCQVADTLRREVRSMDSVFRIGGEEFSIVMPGLSASDSRRAAERIRESVARLSIGLPLTVSIGIANYPADAGERDTLIAGADRALYVAKRSGKNRTVLASEDGVEEHDRRFANGDGELGMLTRLLQRKDADTAGHSAHVAAIAVEVGRTLGIHDDALQDLRVAAQLHDLGKAGIPDEILNKPTALTAAEYEVVKTHPQLGAALLRLWSLATPARIVLEHHERVDGSGYPAGLSGCEISLEARILHAVDGYVAMTLDRPYRAAMSTESAIEELYRHSGSQFDPEVVAVLLSVLQRRLRTPHDRQPKATSVASSRTETNPATDSAAASLASANR